jgi:hypothetical protein
MVTVRLGVAGFAVQASVAFAGGGSSAPTRANALNQAQFKAVAAFKFLPLACNPLRYWNDKVNVEVALTLPAVRVDAVPM